MRIVLVEDSEMLANGMKKALIDARHAVDWLSGDVSDNDFLASNGADLAIIDINLPGVGGFDVLRILCPRGEPSS